MGARSLLRLVEIIRPNTTKRMSTQDLTLNESVRLLDICAHEVDSYADKISNNSALRERLQQVANLIADEAATMKLSQQRWYQHQHKTASKETALVS